MFFLPLFDDNPIKKIPWVTYIIIGLNVLVFLYQSSLSSSELEAYFKDNGFISREFFSNSSLFYSNLYTMEAGCAVISDASTRAGLTPPPDEDGRSRRRSARPEGCRFARSPSRDRPG